MSWLLGLKFEHRLGIAVFVCTLSAYAVLLILGRRWRRRFEAEGVTYWRAAKQKRIAELMRGVWEPGKVSVLYGLAYFTNGYIRTSFSLWVPVFLLNVVGVSTFEAALFVGLMYASWSWKMTVQTGAVSSSVNSMMRVPDA